MRELYLKALEKKNLSTEAHPWLWNLLSFQLSGSAHVPPMMGKDWNILICGRRQGRETPMRGNGGRWAAC